MAGDLVKDLAEDLGVKPELLTLLLRRLIEERRGRGCVDVGGGLRGSWTQTRIMLERYTTIEGATPQEVLDG